MSTRRTLFAQRIELIFRKLLFTHKHRLTGLQQSKGNCHAEEQHLPLIA